MKGLIILSFFFTAVFMRGQPPQRFYGKFGGPGIDVGYGVKQTLEGNYIVVGSTSSYGVGNSDVYLIKVDSMGWTTWQKTFGGFGNDVGRSVIQMPDSGYVIAGFTNSYGAGGYDALIIRTDKNGNFIWQKTFGGTDWDFAYDLVYTSDAHIVICGSTTSFGHGNKDGFMAKYDIAGTLIWQKFFGGVEDDELNAIINTNDSELASVGYTKSNGDLNGDCYFLKSDLNGDTLFTKYFGGPGIDYLTDLIQKPYNEYIVVGAKTYTNSQYTQSAMVNLSSNGSFNWEGNFSYNNGDEKWIAVSNSFALQDQTAYLKSSNPNSAFKLQSTIFVTKNGAIAPYIANSSGGIEDEIMYGMDRTKDGGYVSVGTTNSFNAINGDVFFVKQDSTIINYSSIVGLKENNYKETKPIVFFGDDAVHVILDDNNGEEISIYDITGKLVQSIIPTSEKITMIISLLQPSLYFVSVKLKTGQTFTSKIVKPN